MRFTILPRAKRVVEKEGEFRFDALRIFTVGEGALFVRTLKALCPALPIEASSREDANLVLSVATVFSQKNEYCYLRILDERMEIHCRDEQGARNAACVLAQIIRKDEAGYALPCGTVEDYPDAQYRAFMLESSGRSWLSMERIYQYIREMALARMNVLQFHFMENPGCTIALDCYPDWHGYGPDDLKYSKDEIRAMIAYAAELGVAVCPFVEVISHSVTFNKVAGIACPGDAEPHMFAVCVGQEKTYEAIERVLAEVAELFPDPVIHIGGDEYDMSAVTPKTVHWDQCPHCRALSEKMGYTTYRELFFYAVERVNAIVNKLGKVAMLWNADVKPFAADVLSRNIVMHYYRWNNTLGWEKHYDLWPNGYVEDGFSVLNSHYPQTYLDLPNYVKTENLVSWSYLHDPLISPKNRAKVIGGCCCAWDDFPHFERTIPPAIFLFADRFWNAEGEPVPYDDAYGCALTHALFEGKLPEGMNVFRAVGDVMPPRKNEEKGRFKYMRADERELQEIKAALAALAASGDALAAVYADIADAAIAYAQSHKAVKGPQTVAVKFDG